MTAALLLWLALGALVIALIPWWITYVRMRRRMDRLRQDNCRLQGEIEARLRVVQEKESLARQLRGEVPEASLDPLTGPPAAAEPLAPLDAQPEALPTPSTQPPKGDLLGPIHAALDRARTRLDQRAAGRQASLDAVAAELRALAESHAHLNVPEPEAEAGGSGAGTRGELGLERIVELAGMGAYCDFELDDTEALDAPGSRPEARVHMPGARAMVIHARAPLAHYDTALHAGDPGARQEALAQFARDLRQHIAAVAPAGPARESEAQRPLVVLYLPGEQFISAATAVDPQLPRTALEREVALASPRELLALLRTIRMGWRQQAIAANAEQARQEGVELCRRVMRLTEHLAVLGVTPGHPGADTNGADEGEGRSLGPASAPSGDWSGRGGGGRP